jgi:hypothetical protein
VLWALASAFVFESAPSVSASATNPSLKCVTWALATEPETVVATGVKVVSVLSDQTMTGCAVPLGKVNCTVTGLANVRPAGPN